MIDLKAIEFGYTSTLVQATEIHLKTGSIYALLGRNGKGKSTVIATINGQLAPRAGEILLDNKAISALKANEKAKIIASVSSKFDGVDFLSVVDYISLGQMPYLNFIGILSPEQQAFIQQIISSLQIGHLQDLPTTKISDGERQLAAIARALVQNTPIITLDEPTAFIDYINKKRLIQTLQSIAMEMNKCILFSTHDIELCFEHKINILYIDGLGQLQQYLGQNKDELLSLAFED